MEVREIKLKVRIFVEQDEDGSYHAYCPDLKGLHVFGDTQNEALENAKEGLQLYMQSLVKHDDAIPVGIVCSDITYGSLPKFMWECAKRSFRMRAAKSFVEEVTIPRAALA